MPRKGQFKKGGGRVGGRSTTRSRRSTSTALVRTVAAKPIIIRAPAAVPARRGGHGHRRRVGGVAGGRMPVKLKGELALWASLMGYASTNQAATYEKIPTIGQLPKEAVIAVVGHVFGRKNKHVDRASAAAASVAGYKLGQAGFKVSGYEDDDD